MTWPCSLWLKGSLGVASSSSLFFLICFLTTCTFCCRHLPGQSRPLLQIINRLAFITADILTCLSTKQHRGKKKKKQNQNDWWLDSIYLLCFSGAKLLCRLAPCTVVLSGAVTLKLNTAIFHVISTICTVTTLTCQFVFCVKVLSLPVSYPPAMSNMATCLPLSPSQI